jgi:hypothetical protein
MEERRYTQQQQLDQILEGLNSMRQDIANLREDVAGRVGKLEMQVSLQANTIGALSTEAAKHTANINWLKGAGAASVMLLGGMLIWVLDHLVFKP